MADLLVVDDDSDIRDFTVRFFKKRKIDVTAVSSKKEALSIIEEQTPSFILLDRRMDNMSGMEVLNELRDLGKEANAFTKPDTYDINTLRAANILGISGHVYEPVVLDYLQKIVSKVLDS